MFVMFSSEVGVVLLESGVFPLQRVDHKKFSR